MTPYSISCSTCNARLKVRDERAVGELSLCPKCGSMVMITPPSPGGENVAPAQRSPADSAPRLVVGGGTLGSDFDDAAALLADTRDDYQSPRTPEPSRVDAKDASPTSSTTTAPPQTEKRATKSPPANRKKSEPQSEPEPKTDPAPSDDAGNADADGPHSEPPPIEPPTESMSSIELDASGALAKSSALAQAAEASGSALGEAQAHLAREERKPDEKVAAGAALPPPAMQPPWTTPTQQAWQRYGLIGAGSLAAVVVVSGLLAFLLRGSNEDPVIDDPSTVANVEPIPDPDKVDAFATDDGHTKPPAAGQSGSEADAESSTDDVDMAADEPDEVADDVLPEKGPLNSAAEVGTEEPDAAPEEATTGAPPIFAGDEPASDDAESLETASADTGLGELAPLIDAFPIPPAAPRTPTRPEDEAADTPTPVPTETASRPRPDPIRINIADRLADKVAGINTGGAPLTKVVELITQLSTIPITLSPQALAQTKVQADTPVTMTLEGTTVEGILTAILGKYGLTYDIRGDQIVVVSAASMGELRTVRHVVDDLAADEKAMQQLAEQMTALVAPESWEVTGGEGTYTIGSTAITVKNSFDVQFRVHVFLQKLRVARGLAPRSNFPETMFLVESRTQRAEEKLKTPVRAVFHVEQPLVKVLGHLEKNAGVVLLVDWEALGEVGWPPHSTAAVVADDVPLSEALKKLLDPMDLAYRAIDERTLQVTSVQALTTEGEFELYPAADALAAKDMTPDELIAAVKKELGRGLFVDADGPFEIRYDAASKCLLVRLPQLQQRAAEKLLTTWAAE